MSDEMPKCASCGAPVSLEVGITRVQGLGGGPVDFYCAPHAPSAKGYTLADLQAMKDANQVTRAQRQISLIDQLGPDVYFFMTEGDEK